MTAGVPFIPYAKPDTCDDEADTSECIADGLRQTEYLLAQQERGADNRHKDGRNQRDDEWFLLANQINRDSPQHEHRKRLVAPAEPAPDLTEAFLVRHLPDEQGDDGGKQRDADVQTLADRLLLQLHEVGNDQSA